jgi:hypothetical protein
MTRGADEILIPRSNKPGGGKMPTNSVEPEQRFVNQVILSDFVKR